MRPGHLRKSVLQVSFPLALFSEPRHACNPGRTGEEICDHVLNTTLPANYFISLSGDQNLFSDKKSIISLKKTSPALTFIKNKQTNKKTNKQTNLQGLRKNPKLFISVKLLAVL